MTARKYPNGICLHCKQRRLLRPRGLCSTHYEDPAIRALYPAKSGPTINRGVGLDAVAGVVPYSLPAAPTMAAPGTEAKLAVFAARLRNRQSLFHPKDVRHHNWTVPGELLPIQLGDRSGANSRSRSRGSGSRTCSRCRVNPTEAGTDFRCCAACRADMKNGYWRRKAKRASST